MIVHVDTDFLVHALSGSGSEVLIREGRKIGHRVI